MRAPSSAPPAADAHSRRTVRDLVARLFRPHFRDHADDVRRVDCDVGTASQRAQRQPVAVDCDELPYDADHGATPAPDEVPPHPMVSPRRAPMRTAITTWSRE